VTILEGALLAFLVLAAAAVCLTKHLFASVIIYASYSVVMSLIWVLLAAPDLAITEAAVSTGISGLLFFVVTKRIRSMEVEEEMRKNVKRKP